MTKSLWWYRFWAAWSMMFIAMAVGAIRRDDPVPVWWFHLPIISAHVVIGSMNLLFLKGAKAKKAQ